MTVGMGLGIARAFKRKVRRMEFLVIMRIRDPRDPRVQRRRDEVRDAHLKQSSVLQQNGNLVLGGAIFDSEGNPAGSAAIARFDSRADLERWLENDPWTEARVWQDFEIIPFRIAHHYIQELAKVPT